MSTRQKIIIYIFILIRISYCQTLQELNKAYEKGSFGELSIILNKWSNDLLPLKKNNINSLEKKYVFDILNIFYNKKYYGLKLNRASKIELEYLENKINYWIMKTDLEVIVTDSILNPMIYDDRLLLNKHIISRKIITDMRLQIKNYKMLYLTKKYEIIFRDFLNSTLNDEGNLSGGKNFIEKYNIDQKIKYLNNKLQIHPDHWGAYWIVQNEPIVKKIIFNKNMTRAIVNFEWLYEFGEVKFIRIFNKWILLKSKIIARK